MSRLRLRRVFALAALAAGAFACALPSIAVADPPHGGHFGGGHSGGGHFGGGHFAAHAAPRGRGGWHGPRAAPGGERWHAGFQPRGDWQTGRWRGGDRGDRHWRGGDRGERHWQGGDWGDRHWRGGERGDGHWRGGDWDGRWRGDWDDRYWTGDLWLGGYWNGLYWPPVDYDWNYPWYLQAVPYGAVTIWFGNVPYYYVNRVYYVWSPNYDAYVVADPPPVAGSAQRPPAPTGQGASGVLSLRVTPQKGQSRQQTANDRYACHQWAVAQSGFNPINAAQDAHASSSARTDYRRALTACLHARGYNVQ